MNTIKMTLSQQCLLSFATSREPRGTVEGRRRGARWLVVAPLGLIVSAVLAIQLMPVLPGGTGRDQSPSTAANAGSVRQAAMRVDCPVPTQQGMSCPVPDLPSP